jgi:hypothetical protein
MCRYRCVVQGQGRARQEDSSFVVMSQRQDRTAAQLAIVEKLQQRIVSVFDPTAAVTVGDVEKEKQAQSSRERSALAIVQTAMAQLRTNGKAYTSVVADLNLFCKKTKVELEESIRPRGDGGFDCALEYTSVLRSSLRGSGMGITKKNAKMTAAIHLMQVLASQLLPYYRLLLLGATLMLLTRKAARVYVQHQYGRVSSRSEA